MAPRLKLKRYQTDHISFQFVGAYRLRIEAVDDNTGADPHVFLYHREPINPYSGEVRDVFFAVASPVDLSQYPILAPDPSKPYPFFRARVVELDLPSADLTDKVWTSIINQVNALLQGLGLLPKLILMQEELCGGPADPTPIPGPYPASDSLSFSSP